MRIGLVVAQNFWLHFHEVHETLRTSHEVSIFAERRWPFQVMADRMNRVILRNDLRRFMNDNDATFFEWAEQLFTVASHLRSSHPIITRLHSHELWDYAPRVNWSNVAATILVSNAMERKFLNRFPKMDGRTQVIHNGISLQRFPNQFMPFRGVIGTLGRIDPNKRLYDLVLALRLLRKMGYDLSMRIGGSVTETRYQRYGDELRCLVDRLNLNAYVSFDGPVTDASRWFREIDIFVSNSCAEGLQVSLLEAMASGCYCLSHAWDGVDEALPPENIFVNEADLIERITCYCKSSSAERDNARLATRKIAEERFDIDKQKLKVKQVVESVVAHAR